MSLEASLRGDRKLLGTKITLNDGEDWIIPSLPLNDEGEMIAEMGDSLGSKEFATTKEAMRSFFEYMYAVTKLNYPGLTEADAKKLFGINMVNDFQIALTGQEPKKA